MKVIKYGNDEVLVRLSADELQMLLNACVCQSQEFNENGMGEQAETVLKLGNAFDDAYLAMLAQM